MQNSMLTCRSHLTIAYAHTSFVNWRKTTKKLKNPPNENSVRVIAKHMQDELFADSKPFPSDYSFFFKIKWRVFEQSSCLSLFFYIVKTRDLELYIIFFSLRTYIWYILNFRSRGYKWPYHIHVWGVIRKFAKIVAISISFLHDTTTHMQLIGYNMLGVSHLRALQLSSRQRYIAQSSPYYVKFWRLTTQPIKLQRFVKLCYAVIAHIALHAYLTTYLLLFYANFQRFISKGWCSISNRITVLSRGKAFNFYEPIACFGMSIL